MERGTGTWFDGRSAARQEVIVELAPLGVRIRAASAGEPELAFWEYRELRHVDEPTGDVPMRIRHRSADRGRLVIEDAALRAAISERAPRFAANESGRTRLVPRWAGLLALSAIVLLAFFWFVLPHFADAVARVVPHRWEAAFGETLVEPTLRTLARFDEIEEVAFCTDPEGIDSLAEMTRRLTPPDSPYRFEVRVANLKMVNAFALPGGQIVIAEGLLLAAGSPDEVAGVLAHEMGHVLHRHSTAAIIKGLGLAFLFGAMLGDLGIGVVSGAGEILVGLGFRREAEAEADEEAFALLERAGLNGHGLADFFERMEAGTGDGPAALRFLSTHPPTENRRRLAEERSTSGTPSLDEAAWKSLFGICRRQQPLDP